MIGKIVATMVPLVLACGVVLFAPLAPDPVAPSAAPPAKHLPDAPRAAHRPTWAAGTQFVVVSFDGAGSPATLARWRDIGAATGARFTFFVSGVYLLPDSQRGAYYPPRHPRGASAIGFISAERRRALLPELQAAIGEGHEFATHYNGHFCSGQPSGVGTWNATDWRAELAQFGAFAGRAGLPSAVAGGRTPCLEGDLGVLRQVLRERGMRYDASATGALGTWPTRRDGVWEFPLPSIPIVGTHRSALAMDYNFYYSLARARAVSPAAAQGIRRTVAASLTAALDHNLATTRAPLFVGNHFEHWNHDAYTGALVDFVTTACVRPHVACVSFAQLADYLDSRTG